MNTNNFTLSILPEKKWIQLLSVIINNYYSSFNISKQIISMLESSLNEALEELISLSTEKINQNPIDIILNCNDEIAEIQIIYDSKISLNPLNIDDYELPVTSSNIDNLEIDALWLHLIRKQMDRVYFKKAGAKRIFQFVKYKREGVSAKQFWVLGLKPKLKSNVKIDIAESEKNKQYPETAIIQDSGKDKILKVDKGSLFVIRKLDGKKTLNEIYMEYIDEIGLISPNKLGAIYEKLESADLLDKPNAAAADKSNIIKKIINLNFALPNSDGLVNFFYKYLKFLISPFGFFIFTILGISGFAPLFLKYKNIFSELKHIDSFIIQNPEVLLYIYLIFLAVAVIHEFGHGLVCKHYGGYVSRIGIMFYLAMFIFYCDVSSAWNFPKKFQRIMVSLGGPISTFAIFGVVSWIYYFSANPFLSQFLVILLWILFFSLIMNFNPFIKMDAYYILLDLIGRPNFREESFNYIKEKFLGIFTKRKSAQFFKLIPKKMKIFFWLYGISGGLITILFVIYPFALYGNMLLTKKEISGRLILGIIVILILILRLAYQTYNKTRSVFYKEYRL